MPAAREPGSRAARLVASFLGSGDAPVSPGTAGSLAALLPGVLLLAGSPLLLVPAAAAAILAGFWAIPRAGGRDDPGWVVIDEVAGQWIALLGLTRPTWFGVLAAFALFRALDILKPGPISWADRRHGAFGVMADDVIAGAIGAAILLAARLIRPGWGM